jgi:hypothetical protein
MAADGLQVAVTSDQKITVAGLPDAVNRWLPEIQMLKPALIAALSEPLQDVKDFIDDVEERAALMQELYPTRDAATAAAYEECKAKWRKI